MIANLPEPFRTGMKMCNLWRKEKMSGGLAVTNCLSMYLPEIDKEDATLVARIGYRDGFNIFNYSVLGTQIPQGLRKVLQKTEIEYFNECMTHIALDYCLALNTFTRIITIYTLHDDFFSNLTMP